jgi:hypothetical protein
VHRDGGEHQVCIVQKSCTKGGQTLLFLPGTRKNKFLSTSIVIISHMKVKIIKKNSFGLLELEMAILGFFEEKGHGPLGVNF